MLTVDCGIKMDKLFLSHPPDPECSMKPFPNRAFGAVAFALAVGCGGAPEDLASDADAPKAVAPARQETPGGEVRTQCFRYRA
jgi:hypothetical protein